jgi:hypothetical protein
MSSKERRRSQKGLFAEIISPKRISARFDNAFFDVLLSSMKGE